jgi:cytochrome c-type biogenesis protein
MIEDILTKLTLAFSGNMGINLLVAFAWGTLSILLSPCHLTSIPLIVGYISSQENLHFRRTFSLSLSFALGILLAIFAIGLVTAAMGRMIGDLGNWTNYFVAVVFILMGLYLIDIVPLNWSGFNVSGFNKKGILGAFTIGLMIGVGLGPCTFAFMAPVLALVFQSATINLIDSILLISSFGLGHCGIIVAAGSSTSLVTKYLNWTNQTKGIMYIRKISGIIIFLAGIDFIFINQ